jgi:ABC-type antimicrobial peptide transport system, permease component
MLGIIIGISSVITIVSIGKGGQSAITGEFQKIGVNVIEVKTNSDSQLSKNDYFTMNDVKNIKAKIPEVKNAAPVLQKLATVKTDRLTKRAFIVATNNDYNAISNTEILYGRFINEKDVLLGRNVVLIDNVSAKKIFGYEDCTGKTIKLGTSSSMASASIIGVYKNANSVFGAEFSNMPLFVYTPITFAEKLFTNDFNISQVEVLVSDTKDSESISNNIIRLIENSHHAKGKYQAENMIKQLDQINNIINIFTAIIGAIAGISLVVGGIGVMNIMLVSVTERTREIGIRKAIGATRRDILIQFLVESVIISCIGGIIGMLFGISVGFVAGLFLKITPGISAITVLIAFLFSSAVGIFFGIYPANKASKLDPIEALRYE